MLKRVSLWTLTFFILSVAPRGARAASARTLDADPTITIRVYNQSAASHRDVSEMEAVAGEVFGRSGIKTQWLNCLSVSWQEAATSACESPYDSRTFFLTLVKDSDRVNPHVLGWSALGTARATVFYRRARRIAQDSTAGVPVGRILAHAAAHEIAHLTLGSRGHSIDGLMKEAWGPEDFTHMAADGLFFGARESRLLRRSEFAKDP